MMRFWKRKPGAIVLGQELADARTAEQARVASDPDLVSPMPKGSYPSDEGYLALLNPQRHALDSALGELCRQSSALDAQTNARMRRAISMDEFYTLLAFVRRMALFSIRTRSASDLKDAVNAMALIELARVDHRDISVSLGELCYVANRIGYDISSLLRDASGRADAEIAKLMLDFASRSFAGTKLSDVSFIEEVATKFGPGFVSSGFGPFSPTVDLMSVAIEIAESLQTDRYLAGIQTAIVLPAVWLRGAGEAAVSKVLESATAGVLISGFLRPRSDEKDEGQAILAFVVELTDTKPAETLRAFASDYTHGSHSVLGISEGPLFCLVVGHSMMNGVAPLETESSLARFAPKISAALRRPPAH